MAQSEAVDTSFSNGGERAGAGLPSPYDPEASADSLDRSTYQATHDAIVEAAQASGELQPLTEAEMERRAANEGVARQLFEAEVQREEREIEGRLADQSLDKKEREKLDARLDKLRAIDWRVVCCDVGGEPYEARVTDACQFTRDTFGTTGLVPDDATARMVVTTTSEQGTTQYVIDCYEGRPPLVVAVETPIEGGDRTVAPYLEDWNQISAAPDGADVGSSDLPQGDNTLVRAA